MDATNEQLTIRWTVGGHVMTKLSLLALTLAAVGVLATAHQPAGSSVSQTCGPQVQILDPGLRASFERFEAGQSISAIKICALYRNAADF
jgi:hypothetical protein